ncbi:hypothetical protein KDA08_02875, partial [Candidatus Saccharibacteria bacterium]|nr:hypothetical protein [Candidatus Saccharibacteria bacterium]
MATKSAWDYFAIRDLQDRVTAVEDATSSGMYLNILDFGAVSDKSTDNADAIQAAIDYAHSGGGGTVCLNAGNVGAQEFGVSRTIRLYNDITLKGDGHFNTKLFALPAFYANSGAAYGVASADMNILDDAGYPAILSFTGSTNPDYPSNSHTNLMDFDILPTDYTSYQAVSNANKAGNWDVTGLWGKLFEGSIHNVGAMGCQRGFNIGFNNGKMSGAGIVYFNVIGLRLFNAVGYQVHGYSFVGNDINVDITGVSAGSHDSHHESCKIAYRVGPQAFNTHINVGWAFNIETTPFVIHPSAKVFINGSQTYAQFAHNAGGKFHQCDIYPKIEEEYDYVNYIPDGDMKDNATTPTYWTASGSGSAKALIKRRAIRKYDGTDEVLHNYDGKPRLWCYPGGVAGDETDFTVRSDEFAKLGCLDVRFDTNADIGVKVEVLDAGNGYAVLYDSDYQYGLQASGNSRPAGEVVIAGDLFDLSYAATGPFVLQFSSNDPRGFAISRAKMYKSSSFRNLDNGVYNAVTDGPVTPSSTEISVLDTTGFPSSGTLTGLDQNNQWLTITYTGITPVKFQGCTWSRRFTTGTVSGFDNGDAIHRYFDATGDTFKGFGVYNWSSDGADRTSVRMIVGDTVSQDYPHHFVGWMRASGVGATVSTYANSPSGPTQHNNIWIPPSGVYGDYDEGWHFVDMFSSSSYYLYLLKRTNDAQFAGLGCIRPLPMRDGKLVLTAVPTEGWYRAGTLAVINDALYVCSSGGAPGSWVALASEDYADAYSPALNYISKYGATESALRTLTASAGTVV